MTKKKLGVKIQTGENKYFYGQGRSGKKIKAYGAEKLISFLGALGEKGIFNG